MSKHIILAAHLAADFRAELHKSVILIEAALANLRAQKSVAPESWSEGHEATAAQYRRQATKFRQWITELDAAAHAAGFAVREGGEANAD